MGIYPFTFWQTLRSVIITPSFLVVSYLAITWVGHAVGLLRFAVGCVVVMVLIELSSRLFRRRSAQISYHLVSALPQFMLLFIEFTGPFGLLLSLPFPRRHANWHLTLAMSRIGNQISNYDDQIDLALVHCERARAVYVRLGDELNLAATQGFAADILLRHHTGDRGAYVVQAIDCVCQALGICSYIEHPLLQAQALQTLGVALTERGDSEGAVGALERALSLLDPGQSLPALPKNLARCLCSHKASSVRVATLLWLGKAYAERTTGNPPHNIERAMVYFERCSALLSRGREPIDWAENASYLAYLYGERTDGDPHENLRRAIHYGREAVGVWSRDAFPRRWALAMHNLGYAYERLLHLGVQEALVEALRCYRCTLEIATPDLFPRTCRAAAAQLGWLLFYGGEHSQARAVLATAHQATRRMRSGLARDEAKRSFAAEQVDIYGMLIDCCLREGDVELAFAYAAAAKARAFVDTLVGARLDLDTLAQRRPELRDALAEIAALRREADQLLVELERGGLAGVQRERVERLRRTQAHEQERWDQVSLRYPEVSATQHAPELTPEQARRLAADLDATLVEYVFQRHSGVWGAFVVTAQRICYVPLPLVGPELLRQLDEWREAITQAGGRNDLPYLREWIPARWHTALIAPLGLSRTVPSRLVIAPAGELHHLPFSAAYSPDRRFLADEYLLTLVPSLSAIWVAWEQQRAYRLVPGSVRSAPARRLCVAYAGNDPGSPRYLTCVHDEARAVAQRSCAQLLLGTMATPDQILVRAPGCQLIHLACHGWFDPQRPEQSGLVLSGGVLTVNRMITQLDLHQTMLVTLSACDSGRVEVGHAEEPVSLAHAMMTAGARAVIASLWPVNDHATARLFSHFYEQLDQGCAPALALQRAAQALRTDPAMRSPYFWAAFQVNGLAFGSPERCGCAPRPCGCYVV